MSGDFRMNSDVQDHPKFVKLHRRMGPQAVLDIFRLWGWVEQNRSSGYLYNMNVEDIEIAAKWNGEEGAFYSMLVDLKLLDVAEDGLVYIHNWHKNNPYVVGSEERSNKARFSRLKGAYPELYAKLFEAGFRSIDDKQYQKMVKEYLNNSLTIVDDSLTDGQAVVNESLTDSQEVDKVALTPSPAPSPEPEPSSYDEEKKETVKRKTLVPLKFPVTEQMKEYAKLKCFYGNLEDTTEAFILHHREKGNMYSDWYCSWQKWIRNAVKFANGGTVISIGSGPPKETRTCGNCQWFEKKCKESKGRKPKQIICDEGIYYPFEEKKDAKIATK